MAAVKKIKGRYEIKSKLGEGGMGVVYRCFDPPPMNRDVALKTLLEFPDKTSLQLFYKECEVLKSLAHPNIIEIFDIGEFQDESGNKKPFFVMPLLPGKTLDALIRDESHRLTVERVVDIISQTCRGLQAAHERGLIHRDLKPSNIFVMDDDSVKIIDFGVAHTADSRSRTSGFQKGTLLYMAPEQLQYKPVSAQSDIFSLGVVCYEAMTRRQPFRGSSEEEIVNGILKSIPPPASDINPALNQTISRVIHKAMAKQPWNRYDSAREFGETLQKALRNEPIELFNPARILPRIQRANKAFEAQDYQFASEIVTELEAEGNIDPQLSLLRSQIDQIVRQQTIAQLLKNARARFEEDEDPLALQKIQEILQLDPNNAAALGLKNKIEDRRGELQIDKWLRLAQEHIDNHAYGHARQALQNVLQLRPKETRATRLLSDIGREEEEYLKHRKEKAENYQNALNAWKNGDVSVALSQMALVLDLDRQAPDTSSPELSGTYQSFYNKVRSEHDAINNGYAEARRSLAEREYEKALKICNEILAKYPGQALFQAVKFDVEEQQKQQLSAFVADVDRRLEAERDLDAKVNLLREALSTYPKEPHFESSLKLVSDKRDLVNAIVARARAHEERSQFTEALADIEVLRTIYSPYPGLQFEIERLEKRRQKQISDATKSRWTEQIDRQLALGDYARALELHQKADAEFPGDPELVELQKLAQQGFDRASQAQQLFTEGQALCAGGDFERGLEMVREASRLDDRNAEIRGSLRDLLVERARSLYESDWQSSEALAQEALELDPSHPEARSLRAQAFDRKREELVSQCVSQARRLQTAGDLPAALAEVDKRLEVYKAEPRLTALRDTLNNELRQSQQKQSRLSDLDALKSLQQQAGAAKSDELQAIWERSRVVAERYPTEADVQSVALEVQRIVRERGGHAPTPKPKNRTPKPSGPGRSQSTAQLFTSLTIKLRALLAPPGAYWAAGVVGLSAVVLLGWFFWPKHKTVVVVPGTVQIQTTPAGATVRINHKDTGPYDQGINLEPGEYDVEASLPGYETATQHVSLQAGQKVDLRLVMQPVAQLVRITTPDLAAGEVSLDDGSVGNLETGSLTLPNLANGQHVLRISVPKPAKEEAQITFEIASGAMPSVSPSLETHEMQAVLVATKDSAARIVSSLGTAAVSVDGKPSGQLDAGQLEIDHLGSGIHELTIGQGQDIRQMSFEIGSAPAMDAIFFSDRAVGSILVLTEQDDVTVFVDNKPFKHRTDHGKVHILGLPPASHTIRVSKEGFQEVAAQTIQVLKGQEAKALFTLVPLQKVASLAVENLPAGVQVALDDTVIGTVNSSGILSDANISPGEHTVVFTRPGYQPSRVSKTFSVGDTIRISNEDVAWNPLPSIVEVMLPANATAAVMRGNQTVQRLTASGKIPLEEGTYTIKIRSSSGVETSQQVTIAAGENKPVDLRNSFKDSGNIMDQWTHPWTQNDKWYQIRGGEFVLLKTQHPTGSLRFTVKLHHGSILHGAQRLRWVVDYVDDKNYLLFEIDDKYFYHAEWVDGKKNEFPKTAHNIQGKPQFLNLSIQILPNQLLQRYNDKDNWVVLYDSSQSATTPSLDQGKPRNFTDGLFGFFLPGNEDLEVANFSHEPRR